MTHSYADCNKVSDAPVLSVLAPCYNEGPNIDVLVDRTLAVFSSMDIACELILVDDGSRDDTWNRIAAHVGVSGQVRGVQHSANGGIESAWHTGLAAARGTLVCLIDADLQNRPEDVARLYMAYARGNHDIIQGVRRTSSALTRHRVFSCALNRLLNLTFGTSLQDNKSGFVLCRREVLKCVLDHRFSFKYFQSLIGVAASARGYTIGEVDTMFEPRLAGSSFLPRFPILPSLQIALELLKFRLEVWLFRNPAPGADRRRSKWASASCFSPAITAKP